MVIRGASGGVKKVLSLEDAIPPVDLVELLLKATGVNLPGVDGVKGGKLESDDGVSEGRIIDAGLRRTPLVDGRGCRTFEARVL